MGTLFFVKINGLTDDYEKGVFKRPNANIMHRSLLGAIKVLDHNFNENLPSHDST